MSSNSNVKKELSEAAKEVRKFQINKVLKNPLTGFFEMNNMTDEEVEYYFDSISEGNVLVYVDRTYARVYFYEINKIVEKSDKNYKVDLEYKSVIDSGNFVDKPVERKQPYDIDFNFLKKFVCILKKDPRTFKVMKDAYVPSYTVMVDGRFESTPTGRIKQFGSKDFAVNQVKSFVSGAAQPKIFELKFDKDTNKFLKEGSEVVNNKTVNLDVETSLTNEHYSYENEIGSLEPLVQRLRAIRQQAGFVPSVQYDVLTVGNMFRPVDTF